MAIIPAQTEVSLRIRSAARAKTTGSRVSLSPTAPECNRTILPCRISGNNTLASPIYPTTRLQPIADGQANQDQEQYPARQNGPSRPNKMTIAGLDRAHGKDKMPVSPVPCCPGREGAPVPGAGALAYLAVRHHVIGVPGIAKMARSSGPRHSATLTGKAPGASRGSSPTKHRLRRTSGSAFACGSAPRRSRRRCRHWPNCRTTSYG